MDGNSNKLYTILGIAIAVFAIGGACLFSFAFFLSSPSGAQPASQGGTQTPTGIGGNSSTIVNTGGTQTPTDGSAPGQANTTSISGQGGGAMTVNDFKHDPETKADPNNAGQYYLAGGLAPAAGVTPYSIFFVDANQSFNITLLQEPIGDIRAQAESELVRRLGISKEQACLLNYYVGVPAGVNEIYAGRNLGFSFCPGATQL